MSLSKVIAANTFSQIFGKTAVLIFGILTTIILRRFLGRAGYGDYVFIISFSLMLSALADFGTHLIGVKQACQNKKKQKIIIGNTILLRTFFSLIVAFFGGIVIFPSFFIIISLSLKTCLHIVFHTKLKLFYSALMDSLVALFILVASFILVSLGKGILFLVLSLALANLMVALIFSPLAFKLLPFDLRINWPIIKKIIGEILPMGGILVLYTCYSRIGTIMLKFFKTSEAVGIYGLAYKIHENLNVLAAFLMNSLLPIFSRLIFNKKKFIFLFQITFDTLLISGLILVIFILPIAPLIIKILTGTFAQKETLALRILIFATLISFLNHLTGYSIISLGEQRKSFLIALIALIFNVSANIIFIPLFSFKAVAINTVLTESLVLFLSSLVIWKKLNWLPSPTSFFRTGIKIIKMKGRVFDYD